MSRRSYGTGSLYVRTDSAGRESWHGRWYDGTERVKRKIGPKRQPGTRDGLTRPQAEKALRGLIDEVSSSATGFGGLTIEEAGGRLVRSLDARGRKGSTIAAYESTLRAHLVPYFGNKALARIGVRDVEAFVRSRRKMGRSPKSVRNYLGTLHSIFEHGRIRPNPVADAEKPVADGADPDIRFLTEEEVEALLASTPDDDVGRTERVLYLTAAMTGLRQGELFALRWRDVDWEAMRVRVRRSYARKRGEHEAEFGRPKSKRSSRSVPMHDRIGAELDAHFKRTAYTDDDDLVFVHPHTGGPLDSSKVLKRLKAALTAAGVRRVRFHDLRHTFGTRMAAAGVPIRTLQEWMGHRDIKTTMIYADYSPSDQERELVDRAFSGAYLGAQIERNSATLSAPKRHEQAVK